MLLSFKNNNSGTQHVRDFGEYIIIASCLLSIRFTTNLQLLAIYTFFFTVSCIQLMHYKLYNIISPRTTLKSLRNHIRDLEPIG